NSLKKIYQKLIYNALPNASDKVMTEALLDYMKNKSEFNPYVNKLTLGKDYSVLTPNAFLDISKKLFDSHTSGKGDDTENLVFKHVRKPNDLLSEKINLDFKKKLTSSLHRNLTNNTKVKDIIKPGLFTKTFKSFFNSSQISEPSAQNNPIHIASTLNKITVKGEGGITDEHTVNLNMKSLHPSYFGFLDPIHTPDGSAGL